MYPSPLSLIFKEPKILINISFFNCKLPILRPHGKTRTLVGAYYRFINHSAYSKSSRVSISTLRFLSIIKAYSLDKQKEIPLLE